MLWLLGLWMLSLCQLTLSRDGSEVNCQFGQSCILPCSFLPGESLIIHWIQETTTTAKAHSYFDNKDQWEHKDQKFRGRTSLFQDQISRGNASLQLTGVMVQDEGLYKCFISTINDGREISMNMTVYAPLQKINMNQTKNRIICSSDGIYPEPDLSWSISPSSIGTFQNTTRVQKTEELLYNISSSLTLPDGEDELDCVCTISTPSKQRRASWRRGPSVKIISGEATVSCSASDSSLKGFILVWSFSQSQMIVTKKEDDEPRVSEEWKEHVKNVSESGRLTLQHLSADHEGTYTCEVRNDEETNITQVSLSLGKEKGHSHSIGITVAVIVIIVLICLGFLYIIIKKGFFCRGRIKKAHNQAPHTFSKSSNMELILNGIPEEKNNGEDSEISKPMDYGTIRNIQEQQAEQHCKAAASSVSPSAEQTQ